MLKSTSPSYNRIAMVARWKPVHLGHTPVLRALCLNSVHAFIGIGSSNRYNARNPFTLEETLDMLKLSLNGFSNYTLMPIPDLDDGPRWRKMVMEIFGPLDAFVTANPYVAQLLIEDYHLLKPVQLIPPAEQIALNGSMVRLEMARGGPWQSMVPPNIAQYIINNRLDIRFKKEFGLETLAAQTMLGK